MIMDGSEVPSSALGGRKSVECGALHMEAGEGSVNKNVWQCHTFPCLLVLFQSVAKMSGRSTWQQRRYQKAQV